MQPRQRLAHGRAVLRPRPADPYAVEEGHERRRPARQLAQIAALRIAHGRRAGQSRSRQMLHQPEEERQHRPSRDPPLVERQDERPLPGGHEVVGVLDALGDALVGNDRAQAIAGDETLQLFVGNLGVDGHDR